LKKNGDKDGKRGGRRVRKMFFSLSLYQGIVVLHFYVLTERKGEKGESAQERTILSKKKRGRNLGMNISCSITLHGGARPFLQDGEGRRKKGKKKKKKRGKKEKKEWALRGRFALLDAGVREGEGETARFPEFLFAQARGGKEKKK